MKVQQHNAWSFDYDCSAYPQQGYHFIEGKRDIDELINVYLIKPNH